MVSDRNQSLGRVESSDLVQNGRNYFPGVVGGLYRAHITLGRPSKTLIGAYLGLWRAFLDANQSLGRVERSDLVQSGRNISPDVVRAL